MHGLEKDKVSLLLDPGGGFTFVLRAVGFSLQTVNRTNAGKHAAIVFTSYSSGIPWKPLISLHSTYFYH